MNQIYLLLAFSIFSSITGGVSKNIQSKTVEQETYDKLFRAGMIAYKEKKHEQSVKLVQQAVSDYRYDQEIAAQCWIKCKLESTKSKMSYISILDGQLNFLHYSIRMKGCSELCKRKFLGERKDITDKIKDLFKQKEPYKYLQYSYSQIGAWDKALEAAYTYLEVHPDNNNMRESVNYFLEKSGINGETLQSKEEPRHITLYREGEWAYFQKNYSKCIELFEESNMYFYKELEKCIGLCEEQLETTEMFHSAALFEHYRRLVGCRQTCRTTLTTGKTDTIPGKFILFYYDFLQFCYYKENNIHEAATCSLTYLYLIPEDEKMKNNLRYYKSQAQIAGKPLKPREEAVYFYRQLSLESSLIVIAKGLSAPDQYDQAVDAQAKLQIDNVHESVMEEINMSEGPAKGDPQSRKSITKGRGKVPKHTVNEPPTSRAYRDQGRWKNNPQFKDIKLKMEEYELNGTERVAFDNFITGEACENLMKIVKQLAVGGDGYQHNHEDSSHPFTKKETFEGVSVDTAVTAVEDGKLSVYDAELYFNTSEKMRLLTESYFNLDGLKIAYTHLVCRHAVPELVDPNVEHLSHPIHSDNCIIGGDGEGTCAKRSPAYTWRDYSALLYLNDEFTGGDFVFANHKKEIQASVKPTCGRMVAFHSIGMKNLHGVLGLKSGTRCALPIWFTLSDKSEDNRDYFHRQLNIIKNNREGMRPPKNEL